LVVFDWSVDHAPAASVQSGSEVSLAILDASGGQVQPGTTVEQFRDLNRSAAMPIAGPIFVEGAVPGDVLEVEVRDLTIGSYGWTGQRPGQGILPAADFPDEWINLWTFDGALAPYRNGVSVPLEPFPGLMGVTPVTPGHHDSDPPRSVGGNLDTKQLGPGSRVYFPVEVEGALFGIGDGHAAQGDGEVCGSAIEVSMDLVVRLTVRKHLKVDCVAYEVCRPIERPSAAAAGYYVTTGVEPDLYEAARAAVRHMIAYLSEVHALDPQDAYGLCSVAGDLKISELVDWPNVVVSMFMPKDVFESERRTAQGQATHRAAGTQQS
jgi:acetamidase/formamidase